MTTGFPALDTSGLDITNTLAKVSQIKHNNMINQNLQNQMENRNAVTVLKERKAQIEMRDKILDTIGKSAVYLKEHPKQQDAYTDFYDSIGSRMGLPEPEDFTDVSYDDEGNKVTTWNSKNFETWRSNAEHLATGMKNPSEGKIFTIDKKNPNYDPKAKDSYKWLRQQMIVKDGKMIPLGEATPNANLAVQEERITSKSKKEDAPKTKDLTEIGSKLDKMNVNVAGAKEYADTYNKFKGDSMYLPIDKIREYKTLLGIRVPGTTSDDITRYQKVNIAVDPKLGRRPTYDEFLAAAEKTGRSIESIVIEYNERAKKVK